MLYFCTYFDSNYFIKGLTLYRSLMHNALPFRLWVLCLDDQTYNSLQKLALPEIVPILLADFEKDDVELLKAKKNRSMIEYYFSCTPSVSLFIIKNNPEVDIITYLDADLFFFSNPIPIYKELDKGSILIMGHRFPSRLKHFEIHGIYNVSFVSFRNDNIGLSCLNSWRKNCLEWCYDRCENGRFADQKYLDEWPARFSGVIVAQHKGVNIAPWNIENSKLYFVNKQVLIDSEPLIFFHFHSFRIINRWLYDTNLVRYNVACNPMIKRHIFANYIRELYETNRWVSLLLGDFCVKTNHIRSGVYEPLGVRMIINRILQGELLIAIFGRVI